MFVRHERHARGVLHTKKLDGALREKKVQGVEQHNPTRPLLLTPLPAFVHTSSRTSASTMPGDRTTSSTPLMARKVRPKVGLTRAPQLRPRRKVQKKQKTQPPSRTHPAFAHSLLGRRRVDAITPDVARTELRVDRDRGSDVPAKRRPCLLPAEHRPLHLSLRVLVAYGQPLASHCKARPPGPVSSFQSAGLGHQCNRARPKRLFLPFKAGRP